MRVAFDLDNTLIRCGYAFPLERRRFWARLLGGERLRAGIGEVAAYCRQHGHEVWVYTTSHRSGWHIRWLFWRHGIRLDGVVNQPRHQREARARCSKHPPSFGIDLLIDDAPGVQVEAERHGFRMLLLAPDNAGWVQQVKDALQPLL